MLYRRFTAILFIETNGVRVLFRHGGFRQKHEFNTAGLYFGKAASGTSAWKDDHSRMCVPVSIRSFFILLLPRLQS